MKRERKLVRNVFIISIILFIFYYFGGYYLSNKACVEDIIRGLYVEEKDIIMELRHNNEFQTLVADLEKGTYSIIGTRKIGFLYRTSDCSTHQTIKRDSAVHVYYGYSSNIGLYYYVYRNNKAVDKVEVELYNGIKFTLDEWHQDFAGIIVDTDGWSGVYRAYDVNGNLIEENQR